MKRIIIFICCLFSLFTFASCKNKEKEATSIDNNTYPAESNSNVLVAFFSRPGENWQVGNVDIGNTEVFANYIIEYTGFDSYKIEPKTLYPIDYYEMLDVCKEEQSNNTRPEIKTFIESIDKYDTILLGHPIWNSKTPNIILSFLDHYDFSNKTIITFVTHGGSGFGSSISQLSSYLPNTKINQGLAIEGTNIRNEDSKEKVENWIDSLSLKMEANMENEILDRYKLMEQAMVDANIDILNEVILDGTTFRHMSGKVQTKEEYLNDIKTGSLDYQAYTIENEKITIDGDDAYIKAKVTLTANAYGAQGSWPFNVNAHMKRIKGIWYYTN